MKKEHLIDNVYSIFKKEFPGEFDGIFTVVLSFEDNGRCKPIIQLNLNSPNSSKQVPVLLMETIDEEYHNCKINFLKDTFKANVDTDFLIMKVALRSTGSLSGELFDAIQEYNADYRFNFDVIFSNINFDISRRLINTLPDITPLWESSKLNKLTITTRPHKCIIFSFAGRFSKGEYNTNYLIKLTKDKITFSENIPTDSEADSSNYVEWLRELETHVVGEFTYEN